MDEIKMGKPQNITANEKYVDLRNRMKKPPQYWMLLRKRREMALTFEIVKLILSSRACFKFNIYLFQKLSFIAYLQE